MVSNRGGGVLFVVMHVGLSNTTVLGAISLPACVTSWGFVVVLVIVVPVTTSAPTSVVGSKREALSGDYTTVARDLLVSNVTSFFCRR